MKKKVLLIRLDKIGDLICTLPADQILDPQVYEITWIVQKGMGSVVQLGENQRKFIELDKSNSKQSRIFLRKFLGQNKFDVVISFQGPWWVNYELFLARIPKRIGLLSQWHSFLFLNYGLRQKRSESIMHEFDYNLELVKKLTGPISEKNIDIYFKIQKPNSSEILEKFNLNQGGYTVVHPGMMGSALNWPADKYIDYIHSELSLNKKIVITGTDSDTPYLLKIKITFDENPNVTWLQSKLNLKELVQVLYYSEKVIAPSTGVAHLAASLGKRVHGVYSPIQVHHPRRWKPRGPQVLVHIPNVTCPAQHFCLREKCTSFNCMNQIDINNELDLNLV